MEDFIRDYGYFGVAFSILASGLGFPVPEEIPVLIGGAMVSYGEVNGWIMLPVCIVSVVVGDCMLYCIGRFWGSKLAQIAFIRKHLLTPERFASIAANFQKYGVKILLFARFTPGIRTPIFLTAGITKLPVSKFLLADAIYAIPGVTFLYFLGYWFTGNIIDLVREGEAVVRPIIMLVVLAGVGFYLIYRVWRKPVVTGNPTEMPPLVGPVTETLEGVAESMADKVLSRSQSGPRPKPPDTLPTPPNNGEVHPPAAEAPAKDPADGRR
jgi:membrane protein DedA with SNARE-associated domain